MIYVVHFSPARPLIVASAIIPWPLRDTSPPPNVDLRPTPGMSMHLDLYPPTPSINAQISVTKGINRTTVPLLQRSPNVLMIQAAILLVPKSAPPRHSPPNQRQRPLPAQNPMKYPPQPIIPEAKQPSAKAPEKQCWIVSILDDTQPTPAPLRAANTKGSPRCRPQRRYW